MKRDDTRGKDRWNGREQLHEVPFVWKVLRLCKFNHYIFSELMYIQSQRQPGYLFIWDKHGFEKDVLRAEWNVSRIGYIYI